MKLRNLGLAAAALALPAGFVVASSGLAGAASGVTFKGTLTSTFSGSISISPPLTNTAATGPTTFTTTGTLTALKGKKTQGGVTLQSGKYSSVTQIASGATCTSLESGIPVGAGKVTYKAKGGAATPSTVTFSTGKLTNTAPVTVALGGAKTSGSFGKPSGSKTNATLVVDQSLNTLLGECGAGGVSSITFTGANGPSSFNLG